LREGTGKLGRWNSVGGGNGTKQVKNPEMEQDGNKQQPADHQYNTLNSQKLKA